MLFSDSISQKRWIHEDGIKKNIQKLVGVDKNSKAFKSEKRNIIADEKNACCKELDMKISKES